MYPKQHAVVSGTATFLYALTAGTDPVTVIIWTVIGTAAGVLIDADHAIVSMIVKKRYRKGVKWFGQPVRAVTRPKEFLEDMDYPRLIYHRLVSHTVILGMLYLFRASIPFSTPVILGVAVHIVSDVSYDLYVGNYG